MSQLDYIFSIIVGIFFVLSAGEIYSCELPLFLEELLSDHAGNVKIASSVIVLVIGVIMIYQGMQGATGSRRDDPIRSSRDSWRDANNADDIGCGGDGE